MNLLDLLDSVGGTQSLSNLAGSLGLDPAKANDLITAVAPSVMGAMKKQTTSADSYSNLKNALRTGKHQEYINNPDLMSSQNSVADGNNILGHLFGSKDVSRNVAARAAENTGIDVSLIKKALPLIAGLAMGAVSKSSEAGNSSNSGMSDMLSGLVGDGDGIDLDDMLNLAKKFF